MTASVLTLPTLVLNRSWVAIDTTSVLGALRLLCKGSAVAVQPESYETHGFESWADLAVEPDEPHVRTARLRIRIPEVIALTRYDRVPRRTVAFTRRNLFERDHRTCQYCGCRPGTAELTIDHVIPRSRGGVSSWANCVLACVDCNRKKADRLPAEAGMVLRHAPVAPAWRPTFSLPVARVRQSWQKFISDKYWDSRLLP
ncbi:MAG: HNH endonuclease [Planctomycetes bacterium]|nr:HNH endonuclease [Planctomycetota bacterium]